GRRGEEAEGRRGEEAQGGGGEDQGRGGTGGEEDRAARSRNPRGGSGARRGRHRDRQGSPQEAEADGGSDVLPEGALRRSERGRVADVSGELLRDDGRPEEGRRALREVRAHAPGSQARADRPRQAAEVLRAVRRQVTQAAP